MFRFVHSRGVCKAMFRHLRDTADMSNSNGGGGFLCLKIGVPARLVGLDFPASKIVERISLGRLYVKASWLISRISAMRTRTPASDCHSARICEESSAS